MKTAGNTDDEMVPLALRMMIGPWLIGGLVVTVSSVAGFAVAVFRTVSAEMLPAALGVCAVCVHDGEV